MSRPRRVPIDRWRHRRAMAWVAFVAGILYPILLLSGIGGRDLVELAWPFYTFTGATVGAYIGFATFDDRWQAPREPWRYSQSGQYAGHDDVPMGG